jgi:hypothetical protein
MTKTETTAEVGSTIVERPTSTNSLRYLIKRALRPGRLHQILIERGSEPLHLNLMALPVALFGGYRVKFDFDLAHRRQYAWPTLFAADQARNLGIKAVSVVEFGVAAGAGLLNMCALEERTTKATGVAFRVYGFDSGVGMPSAIDYRDQPDRYQRGDFPMGDPDVLRGALPSFAEPVIGDIKTTLGDFLGRDLSAAPSSSRWTSITIRQPNLLCGSLADRPRPTYPRSRSILTTSIRTIRAHGTASNWRLRSSTQSTPNARLRHSPFLRTWRLFKNAAWIEHMFATQIFDHPSKIPGALTMPQRVIANEYLVDRR